MTTQLPEIVDFGWRLAANIDAMVAQAAVASDPLPSGTVSTTSRAGLVVGNVAEVKILAAPVDPNGPQYLQTFLDLLESQAVAGLVEVGFDPGAELWAQTQGHPGFEVTQSDLVPSSDLYIESIKGMGVTIPVEMEAIVGKELEVITVFDPKSGGMWQLEGLQKTEDGRWVADRIWVAQAGEGSLGNFSSPDDGLSHSGLVRGAFSVGPDEISAGEIKHAIGLTIPFSRWFGLANSFVWPATRNLDGGDEGEWALPYGLRLRVPADATAPDAVSSSPQLLTIWNAAKEYGFIIVGQSDFISIDCDPDLQHKASGDDRWAAALDGADVGNLLDGFPWNQLEVIELGYKGD